MDKVVKGKATGAFSTISELELWQGIRSGEEEKHEAILSLLERVPLDQAMARYAGILRQETGLDNLSLPDAAIAASSHLTGRILVTRNTKDFTQLQNVIAVEFYSNRQE